MSYAPEIAEYGARRVSDPTWMDHSERGIWPASTRLVWPPTAKEQGSSPWEAKNQLDEILKRSDALTGFAPALPGKSALYAPTGQVYSFSAYGINRGMTTASRSHPVTRAVEVDNRIDRCRGTELQKQDLRNAFQALNLDDDDWDDVPLKWDSFSQMLLFFSSDPLLKVEWVSITPEGLFSAAWQPHRGDRFALTFLSTNDVRWVLVRAHNEKNRKRPVESGHMVTSDLQSLIARHQLDGWVKCQ